MEKIKHALTTLALLLAAACPAGAAETFGPYVAVPGRVIDGDTFLAQVDIWPRTTVTIPIRVAGIDAPELNRGSTCERELAKTSRLALESKLQQAKPGEIRLEQLFLDNFGRAVAYVIIGTQDVGQWLLKERLARPYGSREPFC